MVIAFENIKTGNGIGTLEVATISEMLKVNQTITALGFNGKNRN